ncbi:MAG: cytochrome c [Steroidobacteraceae bacterium]|jgi:mono/diheme cytochrome c family protein|nr:cytochrome c [Steroidobacteraceae bacterium]
MTHVAAPSRAASARSRLAALAIGACLPASGAMSAAAPHPMARPSSDHLTFHGTPARSGWVDDERVLTPATVAGGRFGLAWESPPLDAAGSTPPRLFASPLYLARARVEVDGARAFTGPVAFVATTTGWVYAIHAPAAGAPPRPGAPAPGAILWRRQLTSAPCSRGVNGILSTPVIDPRARRLYVTACDAALAWRVHALELAGGRDARGWPVAIDADAVNRPGTNANGANQFPKGVANLQRGALNLAAGGTRLLVTFGGEPVSGWVVAIDTRAARVAHAFSMSARTDEGVGGLWASGGASVDRDGAIYVASGSSVVNALAGKGVAGVFPDSDGNWGQSILRLELDGRAGFRLAGSYTPFDYCQAGSQDIDLGGGAPLPVDLQPAESATPRLLVHGGSKQGNAYLLDRMRMPGSLVRRQPCGSDAARDGSLLAPDPQPQFGTRGPLNVFGPPTDRHGMGDLARSRTTPAYYRSADGQHRVFATGTTKAAVDSPTSVPPSLVRLAIVATPGATAYLRIDATQRELVFQNPGSPVVTSRDGRDAIAWVLDVNKPRSASLYGADAPRPVLYAVDAATMALLWKSEPGLLGPGGKYNEPVVSGGTVLVGTDRLQAFGLRDPVRRPGLAAQRTPMRSGPGEPGGTAGTVATAAASAVATTGTGSGPGLDGAALYTQRCSACHDQARADVPPRRQLARLSPGVIFDKLAFGSMQSQALGLDDAGLEALARWLASPAALATAPAVDR